MQSFQTMQDAVRVAKQVLAGEVAPNLGCGLESPEWGIGQAQLNTRNRISQFGPPAETAEIKP